MFTGLIQEQAKILVLGTRSESGFKVKLEKPNTWTDLALGESISIDGVCLTLVEFSNTDIDFYVGPETLRKTTFENLKEGQSLNLERSLRFGDRLGGHMVSGHVDNVATIVALKDEPPCREIVLQLSSHDFKFVVPKGSICINGVSLTVNSVNREEKTISICLIPETLARTNLANLKTGSLVNLECDQFVKTIAQQVGGFLEQRS